MNDPQPSAAVPPGYARIHYHRPNGDYSGWKLYSWGSSEEPQNYDNGSLAVTATDSYGGFFDVRLSHDPGDLGFLIHNASNGVKDPGSDMHLDAAHSSEAWIVSGELSVYLSCPSPTQILNCGFSRLRAFWIDKTTVAIQSKFFIQEWSYSLVYSETAELQVASDWTLGAANEFPLSRGGGLTPEQAKRYPQLAGYAVFHVSKNLDSGAFRDALRSQLALTAKDGSGKVKYLTGVQTAGVLDNLFVYSGQLGASFSEDDAESVAIRLWAPTAQRVELLLYAAQEDGEPAERLAMAETNGVWSISGSNSWKGRYFLFQVTVYVPALHQIADNIVTDPYSLDLARNGGKSRITDLRAAETKPDGWDSHSSPELRSKNDLSIYELHVRDFSANDASVKEAYQGTYLAFADPNTDGMRHLKSLADAGLKAIHLLPTFHFSSVNEDKSKWKTPGDLSSFPSDGEQQQEAIARVQGFDAYNWGYDPVHYLTPSGAYACEPENRIKEYRQMVQGLHAAGLRVIQDVVFNHTVTSGQATYSVLDKIVPGYYHRLDADGNVYQSSCCANTASEHRMMEKLMVDALVHHARQYKVDGFRFDLMGLHFVSNLQRIREELAHLTIEKDGVDGGKIYLYGEGWEIGETADGALGPNASQINMAGSGIGVFNDRIRDSVRGGSPFSDARRQGFATGLHTDSNSFTNQNQSSSDQAETLLWQSDCIRASLAGNLRDFSFIGRNGQSIKTSQLQFNGQGAGYAMSTIENVNFCSVHDNRTLFDAIQMKVAGGNSLDVRVRRQVLAMSLIVLGQGIPFFQAGDDLLRSKDMDTDSFDSGDWFNRLDFTYQSSNWGVGLPIRNKNEEIWPIARQLLADPALTPAVEHIAQSREQFLELLRIRNSSRLFRMETLQEVQRNLSFWNTGPAQIPGFIVMMLDAHGADYGRYQRVVVAFNGTLEWINFLPDELKGIPWKQHPVQVESSDSVIRQALSEAGMLSVPALTTAVFVSER